MSAMSIRRLSTTYISRQKYNKIGRPNPESNLTPIKMKEPTSNHEKALHELQNRVWEFNHEFWKSHNKSFNTRKSEFISEQLSKKGCSETSKLTAEELSEFYRVFLDSEYAKHMKYLREWMKLNIKLTGLYLIVNVRSLLRLN